MKDSERKSVVSSTGETTDWKNSDEYLLYKTLFEQSPDGVLIIDALESFIDFNEAAHRQLGYSREEFRRLRISDIDPVKSSEEIQATIRKLIETGGAAFEVKHRTKTGEVRDVYVINKPLTIAGRTVVHSIWRDITEQNRAEEALRAAHVKLEALIQAMPDLVFLKDAGGRYVLVNNAAVESFGLERESFIGKTNAVVLPPDLVPICNSSDAEAIERGGPIHADERMVDKEGRERFFDTIKTPVYGHDGQLAGLICVARDDTDRRKAAESLLLFKNLLNQSKDAIFVNDPETGRFLIVNDMACNNLGYSRNELLAIRTLDIEAIFPDQAAWDAHVREVRSKGSLIVDGTHKRRDGTSFPAEVNVTYMTVGERDYMVAVARDISERKLSEQALRTSEERLAKAQKMAHVGNWEWDIAANRLYWSDEVYSIYGVDPTRFVPTFDAVGKAMHPDDLGPFMKAVNAAIHDRQPFEMDYRLIRPDGTERTIHTIGAVTYDAGGKPAIKSGTVQDITDRKRTELALRDSEHRFRSLFESSPVSLWLEDLSEVKRFVDGLRASGVGDFAAYFTKEPGSVLQALSLVKVIDVNRATLKVYGAADKATFLSALSSTFTEASLTAFRSGLVAVAEGRPSVVLETTTKNLQGDVLSSIIQWTVVPGYECCYSRVVVSITDVTDLKRAGAALHESEERFRNILQTVDDAFLIVDRDYRIVSANRAYAVQVNLSLDEIIGRHCYELSHRRSSPCYEAGEECAVRRCFETGLPSTALHKHPDSDGAVMYVETKSYPLRDASGAITTAIEVIHNITDRHLLEEQILRTQKLEAVGILAGGIAHDFNNFLQGVFGSISLAKTHSDKDGKAYAMLEGAESALYQATGLTKQLLTFSKGGEPVKKVLSLPSVVDNAARFALSGSNIRFRSIVDEHLRLVEADDGQLSQVIQNIVLNACDAMPDGGNIRIEMHNVSVDEHSGLPLEKGDYVNVEITDSGAGISEDHLSKIFDPYFTTKQEGSGLGLATTYSIIKKHGGAIMVRSELGAGSTFRLYLPASARELSPEDVRVSEPIPGKGRILVMDDEEIVRMVARHMVEELGYEVSLAENGEQALGLFLDAIESNRPFDAVILDLTIRGGMGGKETLMKMAALEPSVRAIVSSGYSSDDTLSHYQEHGFQDVLIKPYESEALSRVLHGLLHREGPS